MRRPMSHFVDLAAIAAQHGLAAWSFAPVAPAPDVETLGQLPPSAVLAVVHDAAGRSLTVTAAMLQAHITATVSENARHCASWLAVAHLRGLAEDPEYLR